MTKIARKDKQDMLVARQAQAEELRLRRRSEYLQMLATTQAEIDEKRKASRDGSAVRGKLPKTEEERQRPTDMQKAWYGGRTEEEKAVTRKRKADSVALKTEDERRESVKKMVESKATESDADKVEQHLRTKATWASKSKEDLEAKTKKTSETLKKMSPEDRKASLALTEVKKEATAAGRQWRKTLGLPVVTQSEIRSRSWEKNLL